MSFVRVAALSSLAPGQVNETIVNGRPPALANADGAVSEDGDILVDCTRVVETPRA